MSAARGQRRTGKQHVLEGIFPRISLLHDGLVRSAAYLGVMCFMSQASSGLTFTQTFLPYRFMMSDLCIEQVGKIT